MFAIFFEGELEARPGTNIDEAAAKHERRGSIPSGGIAAGLSAQVAQAGEVGLAGVRGAACAFARSQYFGGIYHAFPAIRERCPCFRSDFARVALTVQLMRGGARSG